MGLDMRIRVPHTWSGGLLLLRPENLPNYRATFWLFLFISITPLDRG